VHGEVRRCAVQESIDRRATLSGIHPKSRRRVLVGIRDVGFHQEVLDHLERDPRLEVVGAVARPGALVQGIRGLGPDVTVACPVMVREISHPSVGHTDNLMIVAEEMTVPVLREAIDAGARGVFTWPDERDELAEEIIRVGRSHHDPSASRGRVIAIFGARGGTGTTFIACQLAASLADRGRACALVDLDASFADLTIALGIRGSVRTIADLVPVAGELGPDHLEEVLVRHPRGFSVLLAPSDPTPGDSPPPELYTAGVALLALGFEFVVLHVPRRLDEFVRTALGMADEVVIVVSPDLFSLHAARRAVAALDLNQPTDRCRVLLNPAVRNEFGRREVERVLGIAPFGSVSFDPAVEKAQARGRLLPPKGRRAARDLRLLADKLATPREFPAAVGPVDGEVS
jgi:pilus assembly protein CpaE